MTIKSLFNWGGFGGESEKPKASNEQWHRDGWEHKPYGHGHSSHYKGGGKGGGGNAVLSALALLAFLFLINVMQQSLNDNNSTATMGTTTALLIREDNNPIILTSQEGEVISKSRETRSFDDVGPIDLSHKKFNQIMNKNENT